MDASNKFANSFTGLMAECQHELFSIADWWVDNVMDFHHAGFAGEIDAHNIINSTANKSCILSARLLWFFSKISQVSDSKPYRRAADIAYDSLLELFWDNKYGGVYWEVDCNGSVVNTKKHTYAQSFAIYGLSAYYELTKTPEVLSKAFGLYDCMEGRASRPGFGYHEAFDREWNIIDDVRLSVDEPLHRHNVNTQLHILEAYTALYQVSSSSRISVSLEALVDLFRRHFIDQKSFHLSMFFDENWHSVSESYSYGHDIECSWLLLEAIECIKGENISESEKDLVVNMAEACFREALGVGGEMIDGFNVLTNKAVDVRMWWVQAEAMVGFLNAYEITANRKYYSAFEGVWDFVKKFQKDSENGEWYWYSTLDQDLEDEKIYKAGFWKTPYHNGRAMMEVCKRLKSMQMRGFLL